jgi:hypothetical protein
MKRTILMVLILVLLPFSCNGLNAGTLEDQPGSDVARFAAGLALIDGAPDGALALPTFDVGHYYNASSPSSITKLDEPLYPVCLITLQATVSLPVDGIDGQRVARRATPIYDRSKFR